MPFTQVFAATSNPGRELLFKIADKILNPFILGVFAVALAYFLVGVIQFMWSGESEDSREKGRMHILWGLIGMGVMFAAFAILKIVTSTFGIDQEPIDAFRT